MAFNREKAMTAAAKFAAKGQHDRAAKEYVSVIEADPSDTRTWLLLAEALVNAGDKPGAIERYLHVAEGYATANEAQKAIAVYRKVLGIDPNRLDIQTRIAGLYKDLGRVGDAVAAYEFVAQAYFQAGQIAEGLEGFRMVAELEPAAVGKRLRLAELYSREGMVAQAVEHFRLAADRLLADRRTDDYIRVAERLIYHREDDLPVLRSLAQIYLKQNENRRALVKLNALLRAAPADAEGLELLGETFVAIGKVDKAISVVMELAREQRKGGRKNKETAARVLRKALQWNPENAEDIRKIAGEIEAEVALLPPEAEPKDKGELDLDVDVVEDDAGSSGGDIDLDVDVEDVEVKVEEVPSRPFAPVGANVAPSSAVEAADEGVGDVDKVLLEARVYVKYKMFEHALGHLDAIFLRDASHLGALELQAQILVELDRKPEAADTFVRLAQLVSARDPQLARAHLEQAQKLVPDHTKAEMVLAALDSGGSAETAPLLSGLQAQLQGDPSTPGAYDPAASSSHGVAPTTSIEPSGSVPVTAVVHDAGESSGATPVAGVEASDAGPEVPAATDSTVATQAKSAEVEAAEAKPAETVSEPVAEATTPGETSAAQTLPTSETSGARTPPTRSETSGARTLPTPAPGDEVSGARKLPVATLSEGSGARKLPNDEGSGARKLAALVNEPITEGSVARKLPSERTPLPIKSFGEKTPLPMFKPPPPETIARAAVDAEPAPAAADTATPASDGPTSKTAPTRARPILKPQRKPAGDTGFKPPPKPSESSPEVEELDSGVIEELDDDEVAEVVEKPAPPPRKGPPSRPKPPVKRPPPKPPVRGKATPAAVPEDSKAEAPVPEDSKAEAPAVSEDSKAEAPTVPEDSKAEAPAVSEDSKTELAPPAAAKAESTEVVEPASLAADAKPDSTSEPGPQPAAETSAEPVEEKSEAISEIAGEAKPELKGEAPSPSGPDTTSEPSTETRAETKPESTGEPPDESNSEAKSEPSSEAPSDTAAVSETASEPVASQSEPATEAKPEAASEAAAEAKPEAATEAASEAAAEAKPEAASEAATAAASEAATEAKPEAASEAATEAKPEAASEAATEAKPEAATEAASEAATGAKPEAASEAATEAKPEAASDRAPEAKPEPASDSTTETADATPGSTTEPTIEPKLEPDTTEKPTEPVEQNWPAIEDELDELRFFISGRFEDDAQFAYLDLQRRFPGHPALAEFAERFATGAKLESAAAPVTLDDPRPPSAASRGAASAKVQHLEEEDEDDFLASIFDEPSAPAPGKASGPRRAVATLDDGADAQTFFDLGTAYREMGLEDDALVQFELAAKDPRWTARARIMTASVRVQRGQHQQALDDLHAAMEASNDPDERTEVGYELGVLYQSLGDSARAIAALQEVTPGYRDRDELLKSLA